ncbi:MAG: hypothetical protein Q9180_009821, partial [Flavoplaca navasiana]
MTFDGAVQVTWALDRASDNAFAVAKGVLQAATSDNVQPLALLAAEKFGNTVAMCQQTQLLVEREAGRRHVSSVINFLQASIGYSADDSSSQLASTSAGVRFLCLAAALLCTNTHFEAAQALELMIRNSAGKNQLLPTILQLQDLVRALEPKLMRVGFANSVLGWESYLMDSLQATDALRKRVRLDNTHPAADELEAIVEAFRMVGRVGEMGKESSIVITARSCYAWIIGFIKWCFGSPPLIILADDSVLLEQNDCP